LAPHIELNTPCSSRPAPVRPYHFIEALSQLPSVRRLLQTREHQDAHELFLLLTNAVAEELKSLEKERRIDRGLSVILDGTKIQRDKDGNSNIQVIKDKGIEKERLLSPWEGLTAIRRNCLVCGWCEVIRHEVTGAIDVTVPMNVGRTQSMPRAHTADGLLCSGFKGAASIQECLQQSMAPEIIDDAYCDSCTLNLTINYYISEDQRLSGNNPDTPNGSSVVNKKIDKPVRLAVESVTPASLLSEPALETPRPSAKPTSAKRRRARDARALLRKLEDVKAQGSIGEIVGEGKAKARDLGLQDAKWVKGQGPSSRMSMIARVGRTMESCPRIIA
jgi:ubiquitin carboxyl-terminal hydrolase 1